MWMNVCVFFITGFRISAVTIHASERDRAVVHILDADVASRRDAAMAARISFGLGFLGMVLGLDELGRLAAHWDRELSRHPARMFRGAIVCEDGKGPQRVA